MTGALTSGFVGCQRLACWVPTMHPLETQGVHDWGFDEWVREMPLGRGQVDPLCTFPSPQCCVLIWTQSMWCALFLTRERGYFISSPLVG